MLKELLVFKNAQFGEIRTMTDEKGTPWFVGSDIARELGYSDPQKSLKMHVDREDKLTRQIVVSGQRRKVIIINESGLYSLILQSKLPQARAFKRWVTSEVLPQIRKTGGYIPTKDGEGGELSADEILVRAHAIVGRTLMLLNTPADNCLTATQVAADWGMDVKSFNELLAALGIQYRRGLRWHLADELQGQGLTEDRHFFSYSLHGEPRQRSYLVWTQKGVSYLNSHVRVMPPAVRPRSIQLNISFNY